MRRVFMEKEVEISVEKIYELPEFKLIEYKNMFIAVAPSIAKWIVLENNQQLEIFNMLVQKNTISMVLEKFDDCQADALNVLTQIEAKNIENTNVKSIFSNNRLHFHITNQCNMCCPHCYMKSGKRFDDELSTEEIKQLCDMFRNNGGEYVSLTGGEPTTRNDFRDIVNYIDTLGMKVSIYTNGLAWDEDLVEFVSKHNLEGVQISLDGYDEVSNAAIRGKGVFNKVLKTIDTFIKNGVSVKIAVTAPYEIIKEHKEDYVRFSKELIEKYGDDIDINYSYFFMPGRELSAKRIKEIKDEYFKIVEYVVECIYGDTSEDSFVDNLLDDCIYDSCGYGSLNVMANGDFYFCDRVTDVGKIGNIREMSYEEIYNLMKIAEEAGKIDNFRPCCDCELKYICGGGCRAEFFKEFAQIENITETNFKNVSPRNCTKENKEKIYDLMIKTNERFYS